MFADNINNRISKVKSFIVAGFDPKIENFPKFLTDRLCKSPSSQDESIYQILIDFHSLATEAISDAAVAIKPNSAFFEQYGIGGLKALREICTHAQKAGMPVIMDAKRGDIGSTAEAYAKAYLGSSNLCGNPFQAFSCDALTVNPFLGFDTLEPFIKECKEHGKGIFVLTKTSNPGSASIQGVVDSKNDLSISESVATWISENGKVLLGKSGLSGLGAVVGATYPEEARKMRSIMPNNIFLVPGYGAQGGTAKDVLPNFNSAGNGAIINVSRGLFGSFPSEVDSKQKLQEEIIRRLKVINEDINSAVKSHYNK